MLLARLKAAGSLDRLLANLFCLAQSDKYNGRLSGEGVVPKIMTSWLASTRHDRPIV